MDRTVYINIHKREGQTGFGLRNIQSYHLAHWTNKRVLDIFL